MSKSEAQLFADCRWERGEGGVLRGRVDESWLQGRATFGGWLAAHALRAMRGSLPTDAALSLQGFQGTFLAPLGPGEVELRTASLRSGRNVTFVESRVFGGGELRASFIGAFGRERTSSVAVAPREMPSAPGPESLARFPRVPGLTPPFADYFDFRWTSGAQPFSGVGPAGIAGWVRPTSPTRPDEGLVLALLDSWPPPILSLMPGPSPASTMQWQLEVYAKVDEVAPDAWWFYESRAAVACNGLSSSEAWLWTAEGRLVAYERQAIADFA